jgi:CheY-like chemotaxis protein
VSVISIFSGAFCKDDLIVEEIISSTAYALITDEEVLSRAGLMAGIDREKLRRAFSSKTSVFNKFTHEKERSIAHLKMSLAEFMREDNLLISGYCSQLIPASISHVLRVCLIADLKYRIKLAMEKYGLTEKEAVRSNQREDEDRAAWIELLLAKKDPWDPSLYDLMIPMDKTAVEQASALIQENAFKSVVKPTETSRQAVSDFLLAAKTEVALTGEGHQVEVRVSAGEVTLILNKYVLMLSRLEDELRSIVKKIPGVQSLKTEIGKDFHQTTFYRKHDINLPSKVLLVDDEREYAQTLSERLQLRHLGTVVAYDGESALALVQADDPEVMVLDLKMPGIDGIEVLQEVKATRPEIEVIVLTGHGGENDKEICLQLGAFAYLQKPIEIDELLETLQRAYDKIRKGSKRCHRVGP